MFLFIDYFFAGEVRFNNIFEATIVPKQTKFYDMIAKLFPLHSLIAIDVDLFEKIN